jgi:hypothetical protein
MRLEKDAKTVIPRSGMRKTHKPDTVVVGGWHRTGLVGAVFASHELDVGAKTVTAAVFPLRCNYAETKERTERSD